MKHSLFHTSAHLKRIAYSLLFIWIASTSAVHAQAPKWVEKAQRAVIKITTYDAQSQKIGEGLAFYIDETGTALSSYSLFKGVEKATATDYKGEEHPVDLIMGFNDLYDVIKVHVAPNGKKKNPYLKLAAQRPAVGDEATTVGFSENRNKNYVIGAVEKMDPMDGDSYYTLSMVTTPDMINTPVLNKNGEVFGMIQPSTNPSQGKVYALSAHYANNLSIQPLSLNNQKLNAIGIPKDLPTTRDEALTMIYLAQNARIESPKYLDLINRFITRYPKDTEGYKIRSTYYTAFFTDEDKLQAAEEDMKKVAELSSQKDEAFYHTSQCILNYVVRKDTATQAYKDWSYERCLSEIQKAIEINPLPLYYQQLGNIHSLTQNYREAYEAYEKVNASNLASPSTFYASSRLLRLMNDTTGKALSLMDSCIAHFPKPFQSDAAPYLFERAEMRVAAGNDEGALEDYNAYEQAVHVKQNALFYYKREQVAVRLKKHDQAMSDIQKALELLPQDPTLLEEKGSLLVSAARYDEALASLNAALKIDANRSYSLRLKGFALLQQEKKEEAKDALTRAQELGDTVSAQLLNRYFK